MLTYEFRIRLGDPVNTSRLQQVADTYFKNVTTVGYAEFQNVTIYNGMLFVDICSSVISIKVYGCISLLV